ncbi:hypothetical protein OEOE_1365 [Oenococcus oeni PSU-1]|uniref:Uncharacterized protein n=1 Tax=Oenococcus oeni (strain ATCC BAA-331 / PSU-1) TaxID=203123 RepID=Q04E91_OENOB|nr:hypothetical protein OEOE_1365 [Oenococcus oeni PSU-1]
MSEYNSDLVKKTFFWIKKIRIKRNYTMPT